MRLFLSAVALALSAIRRNKLRAALTVLGIFIGITAVVMVTALAGGASESVGNTIDSFGSNLLFVFPERVQRSGARGQALGRLTDADGRAIARDAISVSAVAPWISSQAQVVAGDQNTSTTVAGTTLAYFPVRRFSVQEGEQWTESDEATKSRVCIVGRTVAAHLFGEGDPVGRVIRIGGAPFRIVGQLAPKGTSPFGEDQDDRILMPVGSYRGYVRRTWPGRVDMLLVSASSEKTVSRAEAQITSLLRQRHRIADDSDPDFTVASQAEMRATQQGISDVLSGLLLAVAAVSLVVGGIGVMNIMLVSVAERTREIGIRLSIGARENDILVQFLVEAIVLSLIGGVLGVALGGALTVLAGKALGWNTTPTVESVGLAFATSAFIGVVFGFVPARRAARLDPIDALRQE